MFKAMLEMSCHITIVPVAQAIVAIIHVSQVGVRILPAERDFVLNYLRVINM